MFNEKGKLIYQKTIMPFRIYVYDNVDDIKIVINRMIEYETGEKYVQHFSFLKSEFKTVEELLNNSKEVF